MKRSRSFETCPNCGAPTPREYCDTCGQRNLDLHGSLGALIGEAVEELLGADSRLGRTLFALFFRPGYLSREYRAGRRAHFTSPIKLYLAASALFFVFGVSAPPAVHVGSDGLAIGTEPPGQERKPFDSTQLESIRAFVARFGHVGARVNAQIDRAMAADPQVAAQARHDFELAFFNNLPRAMILLLPAFALLLKLLYWRRFLIDHLVFVLHLNAASFCAMTVNSWFPERFAGIAFLVMLVYGTIALRTMYEQSWWKTILKGFLFGIGSLLLVGAALVGLAAVEFLLF
jgi:hypothetical protein